MAFHIKKCVISKVSGIIHQRWHDKTPKAILNSPNTYILGLGLISVKVILEEYDFWGRTTVKPYMGTCCLK